MSALFVLGIVAAGEHWFRSGDPVIASRSAPAASTPYVPGESFYGDPLPADHPLIARVSAPGLTAHAEAPQRSAPLDLRQGCRWGQPGSNPYRGNVVQALTAAGLPEPVVRRIHAMVQQGLVTDRVEISNQGIRSVSLGLEFSPRRISMTFGNTLCVDTQVNFVAGHVERADLFQVSDASGEVYSVVLPYVCGNVSVLGARSERGEGASDGGTSGSGSAVAVPAPGTLLLVPLGLASMLWLRRQVRRPSRTPPRVHASAHPHA